MITFIHNNPVVLRDGLFVVDRKFHTGMLDYGARIPSRLVTVHPLSANAEAMMDPVEISLSDLPYGVLGLRVSPDQTPDDSSAKDLARTIHDSRVVVGWGYGAPQLAMKLGRRYIACLEYDLQTQIVAATSFATNPVRKLYKAMRVAAAYWREMVPVMRGAYEIHCNGYPMHEVAQAYNARTLMYLDSRMRSALVIREAVLDARLKSLRGRRLRLLFSGRFEKMKGALDAVVSARRCLEHGIDLEMHCYGSGSLAERMRREADKSSGRIVIHDPIPFEDLVQRSHEADIFVCCHIQSDPSCTYLESMGAGLPVVGYANRMWSAMARASGAGLVVPQDTPDAIAGAVMALQKNPDLLMDMSRRARAFALAHCFEQEFRLRTEAISAALAT
jgi:colanic acid/amylovoran biosynthesis glycosyltransferase